MPSKLDRLKPEHLLIAQEVALRNANPSTIAQKYGYNYNYVCSLLHDTLMEEEINRIRKNVEDRMIQQTTTAMGKLYDNLEAIMDEKLELALHAESAQIRDHACTDLLRFAIRVKGEDKEKPNEQKYLAVQLNDTDKYKDDPDVNPQANPNVVSILESRKRDGTNDE